MVPSAAASRNQRRIHISDAARRRINSLLIPAGAAKYSHITNSWACPLGAVGGTSLRCLRPFHQSLGGEHTDTRVFKRAEASTETTTRMRLRMTKATPPLPKPRP